MMNSGDIIHNPATGETVTFLETGAETGGEVLKFEMTVAPGGAVAAEHIHPSQSESFVVERGELILRKDGGERTYRPGDDAEIPPGTPHVWWNAGDDELRVLVEFRPAARFSEFLESLFALASAGETDDDGMPGLLQMAVMMEEFDDVIYPSSPPRAVQKLLFGILGPVGRLFGYDARRPYPEDRSGVAEQRA